MKVFKHKNGNVMVITDPNHLSLMERFGYKEVINRKRKAEEAEETEETEETEEE